MQRRRRRQSQCETAVCVTVKVTQQAQVSRGSIVLPETGHSGKVEVKTNQVEVRQEEEEEEVVSQGGEMLVPQQPLEGARVDGGNITRTSEVVEPTAHGAVQSMRHSGDIWCSEHNGEKRLNRC